MFKYKITNQFKKRQITCLTRLSQRTEMTIRKKAILFTSDVIEKKRDLSKKTRRCLGYIFNYYKKRASVLLDVPLGG